MHQSFVTMTALPPRDGAGDIGGKMQCNDSRLSLLCRGGAGAVFSLKSGVIAVASGGMGQRAGQ